MGNKFSNIKERILYIAENQEGNKQTFCKKIGVTYGNFTGKNKETPINSTAIENILLNYPNVNIYWLITGKGEILRKMPFEVENNFLNEPNPEKYGNAFNEKDKIIEALSNSLKDKEEILSLLREKIIRQENEILELKKR